MNAPLTDSLRPTEAETYLVTLLTPTTRRALRDEALVQVEPGHFSDPMHESLWAAARSLRDDDTPITARNLLGRLRDALQHRGPGDHDSVQRAHRFLNDHAGHVPDVHGFSDAVATVARCGKLRALCEVLDSARYQVADAEDPSQALGLVHDLLGKLDTGQSADEHIHHYGDLLDQFIEAQRTPDTAVVIPTPWDELNEQLLGGLRTGRMYVVGGRPGDGKSISLLQIAQHAAECGHHAQVYSAEMGAAEVTDRLVSSGAVVEQSHITRRQLNDDGWTRVGSYYNRARNLPLTVVDKPNLTMSYIKATAREAVRRYKTRVLALDYLQLVGGDSRGTMREQEVAAISRGLKQLSRELDVAVVVAAQLNRSNVRESRRPVSSDLRESGGIEADADVVILHWRPTIEDGPMKGEPGYTVELGITKNRIGRTGRVELDWRAHYATIGSASQQARVVRS